MWPWPQPRPHLVAADEGITAARLAVCCNTSRTHDHGHTSPGLQLQKQSLPWLRQGAAAAASNATAMAVANAADAGAAAMEAISAAAAAAHIAPATCAELAPNCAGTLYTNRTMVY